MVKPRRTPGPCPLPGTGLIGQGPVDIRKLLILNAIIFGIGFAQIPGVRERVLVVDDCDTVRKAYRDHFVAGGFEVQGAASLKEAAELLAGADFDAVIADVCLSASAGSEGLAIAAYLRQTRRDPPVVVLTAYGQPQAASAAARLGVDAFLHKPVSLVWLERLVRSRLDERRGKRPAAPMAAAG